MSNREIAGHLRELYGVVVSADLMSEVIDAVLDKLGAWQSLPPEPVRTLVSFDTARARSCCEGLARNKTVPMTLGVMHDGGKENRGLRLK